MEENSNDLYSVRDFCYIFFRYKAQISMITLSALCTVILAIYIWPESYESRASILVKMGRENVSIPTLAASTQQQVVNMGLKKEDINSEIEILRNRLVVEETVRKLGTDFLFPEPVKPETFFKRMKYYLKRGISKVKDFVYEILYRIELKKRLTPYQDAVLAIQKKFSVKQVKDSDVIEARLTWSDPDIGKKILDTLIGFYVKNHLEAHRTSGRYEFFQNQVKVIGDQLRDSEDQLKLLKSKEKITFYDDQRRFLLGQIESFKTSLSNAVTDLTETRSKIDELKKKQAALMKRISPGFNDVAKQIEQQLLSQDVRAQALRVKKEMLAQHIQSYEKDLKRLNLHNLEFTRLKRRIQIDEKNYLLYRKKLEEARISDVLDSERVVNVRVIDPAAASFKPVRPKKLLTVGLGLLMSLILGIGSAFLADYLDHSIRMAEDVRRYLDLPLLASIREIRK